MRTRLRAIDDARTLLEIVDPQRRTETSGAGRWQDMIRSRTVISQRLRAVVTTKNRASVPNSGQPVLCGLHHQLEMFGSNPVRHLHSFFGRIDLNQCAMALKRCGYDPDSLQLGKRMMDLRFQPVADVRADTDGD